MVCNPELIKLVVMATGDCPVKSNFPVKEGFFEHEGFKSGLKDAYIWALLDIEGQIVPEDWGSFCKATVPIVDLVCLWNNKYGARTTPR